MHFTITFAQAIVQENGHVERPILEIDAEGWYVEDASRLLVFHDDESPLVNTVAFMPVDQVLHVTGGPPVPSGHGSEPATQEQPEASPA